MENSNMRGPVDIIMATGITAVIGFAAGTVVDRLVSKLPGRHQVGSNIKYPQITTGKVCGHFAESFAVIGATYIGVKWSLERYRMKKDVFNHVGGGLATAAVVGFRARRFRAGLWQMYGTALVSVLHDNTGMKDEKGMALVSVLHDHTGMKDEEEKGQH